MRMTPIAQRLNTHPEVKLGGALSRCQSPPRVPIDVTPHIASGHALADEGKHIEMMHNAQRRKESDMVQCPAGNDLKVRFLDIGFDQSTRERDSIGTYLDLIAVQ